MEKVTIGQLIYGDAERDAIHIAIAPVVAGHDLRIGQSVVFEKNSQTIVVSGSNPIGIVDPFLRDYVHKGEKFYIWLYPNTIVGLRHMWLHPAFPTDNEKADAIIWLRSFAEHKAELPYQELMNAAEAFLDYGNYLCQGGRWEGFDFPQEFWQYYEQATGATVPRDKRHSFFSCSC